MGFGSSLRPRSCRSLSHQFLQKELGPASSEAQAWPERQQVPGLQGGAPCPHGAGSVVFTVTWPGKPARKGLGTIRPFLLLPLRSFL